MKLAPEIGVISPTDLSGAVWECQLVSDAVDEAKLLYYLSSLLIKLGL